MNDEELKSWAEAHAPAGCSVAKAVLRILTNREMKDDLIRSMARRIAAQSELLSKCANSKNPGLEEVTLPGSFGGAER